MIFSLVWLLLAGLVIWALIWLVDYIGVPAPVNRIVKGIILLVGLLWLVNWLLVIFGNPGFIRL